MDTARLPLSHVTLVAIDTIARTLTALALHDCLDKADFAATIVLFGPAYRCAAREMDNISAEHFHR